MNKNTLLALVVATFLSTLPALAGPADTDVASNSAEAAEMHADAHEHLQASHEYHKHHLGLLMGAAVRYEKDEHTESGAAIGIEYENRLSKQWGIGGIAEAVFLHENHRDAAFALPISFRPIEPLKLAVGPGFEVAESEAEFMGRVSVTYDIPVAGFTISPDFSVDFLKHTTVLVMGITFGKGF